MSMLLGPPPTVGSTLQTVVSWPLTVHMCNAWCPSAAPVLCTGASSVWHPHRSQLCGTRTGASSVWHPHKSRQCVAPAEEPADHSLSHELAPLNRNNCLVLRLPSPSWHAVAGCMLHVCSCVEAYLLRAPNQLQLHCMHHGVVGRCKVGGCGCPRHSPVCVAGLLLSND